MDVAAVELACRVSLFFFAGNFLLVFAAFFVRNDLASKLLFKVDIDAALSLGKVSPDGGAPNQLVREWASSAVVFHRMEVASSFSGFSGPAMQILHVAVCAIPSSIT